MAAPACRTTLVSAFAILLLLPTNASSADAPPPGTIDLGDGAFAVPLRSDPPAWYTPAVHERVLAASARGLAYDFASDVEVPLASPFLFIRPGAMMVSPSGCTMNFVYGSPGSYLLGSAGHCNHKRGEPVVVLAAPTLLAAIGTTRSAHENGIGDDWSLTLVYAQFQQHVDPNVAVVGGPQCDPYSGSASLTSPVPVKHVGHGLVIGTGGTPRVGVSTLMDARAFFFDSASTFGDSGSPVLTLGRPECPLGQAIGILTHIVVDVRKLPSVIAGTRVTVVPADVVPGDVNPIP